MSFIGVSATTVALRGLCSTSAISPTIEPGPEVATCSPRDVDAGLALEDHVALLAHPALVDQHRARSRRRRRRPARPPAAARRGRTPRRRAPPTAWPPRRPPSSCSRTSLDPPGSRSMAARRRAPRSAAIVGAAHCPARWPDPVGPAPTRRRVPRGTVMKAAVMRNGELVVDEIADPRRAPGRCWSARWPAASAARTCTPWPTATCWWSCPTRSARTAGDGMPSPEMMDLDRDVVMGHEFAAEVVELGPDLADGAATTRWATWWCRCRSPSTPAGCTRSATRTTTRAATASCMVLNDLLCLKVPNGLDAALGRP